MDGKLKTTLYHWIFAITAWAGFIVSFVVPAFDQMPGWKAACLQGQFWQQATHGNWLATHYILLSLANLVMLLSPWQPAPAWRILVRLEHPAHAEVVDLDGDGIQDLLVADLGSFLPAERRCGTDEHRHACSWGMNGLQAAPATPAHVFACERKWFAIDSRDQNGYLWQPNQVAVVRDAALNRSRTPSINL